MAEMYRKLPASDPEAFDRLLQYLVRGILNGSMTASLEASHDFAAADCRAAVRVFERYGWSSSNRLSLSLTLFQGGDEIEVYAVGSGASSGMFLKINTWSEEGFVNRLRLLLDDYKDD